MGRGHADCRTVLDIEPSLVLLGEQARAVASLHSGDLKPLSRRVAKDPWGLFGAGSQLGASPALYLPIDFQVPSLAGDVSIEAYRMAGESPAFLLARRRLVVFEGREQMLARALREPVEADGLAVFRSLAALPWSDESARLEDFRRWLDPYAGDRSARGRHAFAFLMELHEKHLERIVRRMAAQYGKSCHHAFDELLARLQSRMWQKWEDFEPGRGRFTTWAYLQLLDCRKEYRSEEGKQRHVADALAAAGVRWDAGDLGRFGDCEEGSRLIRQLLKRFPELDVTIYLMRVTETPPPTLLEIADRFGIQDGAERKTREAAISRILTRIENYLRIIAGIGGTK
jgi:Sigma-70 region 2